jgi:hypothetical protein
MNTLPNQIGNYLKTNEFVQLANNYVSYNKMYHWTNLADTQEKQIRLGFS